MSIGAFFISTAPVEFVKANKETAMAVMKVKMCIRDRHLRFYIIKFCENVRNGIFIRGAVEDNAFGNKAVCLRKRFFYQVNIIASYRNGLRKNETRGIGVVATVGVCHQVVGFYSAEADFVIAKSLFLEKGINLSLIHILREGDFGEVEGMTFDEVRARFGDTFVENVCWPSFDNWDIHFPGGESKREIFGRVLHCLNRIVCKKDVYKRQGDY